MHKNTVLSFLIMLMASMPVFAKGDAQWKVTGDAYKSNKNAVPVSRVALAAVNVDVGIHLERLTLISGEGHGGKKAASTGLALGLTLLGVGGVDTASREPLEEHLTQDDARRIADEIEQIVQDRFSALPNVGVVAGEAITGAPWYATLDGYTEVKQDKMAFSEGRFSPDYYFGYYSVPAAGYRYRPAPKFSFGDKTFSPVIRSNTGADVTAIVNVFLVNTRKDFRIHQMTVSLYGIAWPGQKNGDTPTFSLNLNDAGAVGVPVTKGEHKDNYAYWQALRPLFEAKVAEAVQLIQRGVPMVAAAPVSGGR